ncbi:DUF6603 domain-containing protein [Micromonospora sp. ATCC 39149]
MRAWIPPTAGSVFLTAGGYHPKYDMPAHYPQEAGRTNVRPRRVRAAADR